jgi:hypothetical protein
MTIGQTFLAGAPRGAGGAYAARDADSGEVR